VGRRGAAGQGLRPNSRRERFREVGRTRSTEEAGEQSRIAGCGARGGKEFDQGKRMSGADPPDTAPDLGFVPSDKRTARKSTSTDRYTQGKSRMR
jgi:hypothetical protein